MLTRASSVEGSVLVYEAVNAFSSSTLMPSTAFICSRVCPCAPLAVMPSADATENGEMSRFDSVPVVACAGPGVVFGLGCGCGFAFPVVRGALRRGVRIRARVVGRRNAGAVFGHGRAQKRQREVGGGVEGALRKGGSRAFLRARTACLRIGCGCCGASGGDDARDGAGGDKRNREGSFHEGRLLSFRAHDIIKR